MLRKRFFVAAVVAAGSCVGLAGGVATAPAAVAVDVRFAGPVLGYCSEQTEMQKRLLGEFKTYAVACLDNSAGGPIGPECMIYTDDMSGSGTCEPWPV